MTTRYKTLSVLLAVVGLGSVCLAQGSAGTTGPFEPRFVIDKPTAGMLSQGEIALDLDLYRSGGALFGLSVGVFDRLMLGASYGGTDLIGGGEPTVNPVPGVAVKIRIIEEAPVLPAIALGFDSQGRDGYVKGLERYRIKSPGFFGCVSKNYAFLGFLSLSGGVTYSLEKADGDDDINGYVGVEKSVGSALSLLVEYDLATNDNSGDALGRGRGYLNAALRWAVGGGVTLGLFFGDLLENGSDSVVANRSFRMEFVTDL